MTIKPLPSKEPKPHPATEERINVRQLNFRDGLEFSFGFWVGSVFFFAIVGPVIACVVRAVIMRL